MGKVIKLDNCVQLTKTEIFHQRLLSFINAQQGWRADRAYITRSQWGCCGYKVLSVNSIEINIDGAHLLAEFETLANQIAEHFDIDVVLNLTWVISKY